MAGGDEPPLSAAEAVAQRRADREAASTQLREQVQRSFSRLQCVWRSSGPAIGRFKGPNRCLRYPQSRTALWRVMFGDAILFRNVLP